MNELGFQKLFYNTIFILILFFSMIVVTYHRLHFRNIQIVGFRDTFYIIKIFFIYCNFVAHIFLFADSFSRSIIPAFF